MRMPLKTGSLSSWVARVQAKMDEREASAEGIIMCAQADGLVMVA